MSSLAEINFNYRKALKQASQLEAIATKIQNASPAYLQKGRKVQGDISTIGGNLKNIASTIRTVAQIIYEAELEAWRIAHERD